MLALAVFVCRCWCEPLARTNLFVVLKFNVNVGKTRARCSR